MHMNSNWTEAGIVFATLTTLAGLAVLYRRVSSRCRASTRVRPGRPGRQYSTEVAELRDLVIALQSKVEELVAAEGDRAVSAETRLPPSAPQSAINMNKRSEALRMYNRGGDHRRCPGLRLDHPGPTLCFCEKFRNAAQHTDTPNADRTVYSGFSRVLEFSDGDNALD